MPLDPRTQQALAIAPGQQFSPWQNLAQHPGMPEAAPAAPEYDASASNYDENGNLKKNPEQEAAIAALKKRAAVDPQARRQLQLILESQ